MKERDSGVWGGRIYTEKDRQEEHTPVNSLPDSNSSQGHEENVPTVSS